MKALLMNLLPTQAKLASDSKYHMVGWELEVVKLVGVVGLANVGWDPHVSTCAIAFVMLGVLYFVRRRWKKCLDSVRRKAGLVEEPTAQPEPDHADKVATSNYMAEMGQFMHL